MTYLRKHTLPLVLVVHVHAGQEDAVRRVGVDPAQEGEVLLLVELQHVLIPLHSAAVRLALLFGNQEVSHTELVVAQLTTEGPKSLDIPVTVGFSNFKELGDEIFWNGDCPQTSWRCLYFGDRR